MNCVLQSETEAGAPAEESEKPKVETYNKKSLLYHAVGYTGAGLVILAIVTAIAAVVTISWLLLGAAMAF